MKIVFLFVFLSCFISAQAQYVGPARNTGREYGNSKMPLMVSHLAGANKERLRRVNKNSHHSVFGKIICFRKLCRIQSGHSAPLHAISFKKFKKKVARNAKKGAYKKSRTDSVAKRPAVREAIPLPVDTVSAPPVDITPLAKADSLIVLGAELLFETNQSTLRSEHFVTLQSIVSYLHQHAERLVSISGHTDNTGVEARNLNLSRQRADVVAEYLVSNGIDIRRVETSGQGSARPIAENKTNEGRKKNRRVELLIHDR